MIVKALVGAALLLAPFPVAPSIPLSIDSDAIPKVICPVFAGPVLRGISYGSAFRVGGNLLLSVKHVTSVGNCIIDGQPITVRYESPDQDFSILSATPGPRIPIDCGGFHKGQHIIAIGHARGRDELTTIALTATGVKADGLDVLFGVFTVIPGMSGGVLVDADTGRAVGTVNRYDPGPGLSMSQSLKDTPICHS